MLSPPPLLPLLPLLLLLLGLVQILPTHGVPHAGTSSGYALRFQGLGELASMASSFKDVPDGAVPNVRESGMFEPRTHTLYTHPAHTPCTHTLCTHSHNSISPPYTPTITLASLVPSQATALLSPSGSSSSPQNAPATASPSSATFPPSSSS